MPRPLKIVFMGTPEFAVASLKALHQSIHPIIGVVTAPDKPAGRGKQMSESAVKKYAVEHNLKILQPSNLKASDFIDELKALNADLFVVVAFRMLPAVVWQMPPEGTINLHASLLPQYRGAAPINWAIINENIDTGDLIANSEVTIFEDMNAGQLHDILMIEGANLLLETVNLIAENQVKTTMQIIDKANNPSIHEAPKITRENLKINWNKSSKEVINLIRGMSPYPGAYCTINQDATRPIKIFKASVTNVFLDAGAVSTDEKTFLLIGTKDNAISVEELQVPNKKRMPIKDLLNGYSINGWKKFD